MSRQITPLGIVISIVIGFVLGVLLMVSSNLQRGESPGESPQDAYERGWQDGFVGIRSDLLPESTDTMPAVDSRVKEVKHGKD